MKKQLGLTPETLPHQKPIFQISDHYFEDYIKRVYLVDNLVVINRQSLTPFMGQIVKNQIEIPLKALPWLVDAVEIGFGKKPSEGGLAKDVFNMKTTIEGEGLFIRWGVSVAGEGIGGYTIKNHSRKDYIADSSQEFAIAHDIMIDQLIPLFKNIIEQHL